MFKPLSTAYLKDLSNYLHNSQGLLLVKKGDFFPLFWRARGSSFKKNTIQKSFTATGIWPPDPTPILKRFNRNSPEVSSSDESSTSLLIGSDWRKIKALVDQTTADRTSKEVKKLHRSLYHISTQNELLRHEMKGLKEALSTKEKSELKEQARLYKLQVAQEKRVERQRLKEVREKERAKQVAERARQKADRDSTKAIQQAQNNKRKASKASIQNNKRQKCVVAAIDVEELSEIASAPPPLTTRRGRNIKLPSRYK
ncbi:conserved hypothetical protein [Pyrenophora tritici-repentis Pt-1C-BFP]|nr:uncharacterized protein PTRG_06006 [Pyrenophora tritici-repentis Pt-1C-BFP]EDU48926.1 conserved hypothetical protein [Pyrenophora tritici-repentis Pt-1C-BFP]